MQTPSRLRFQVSHRLFRERAASVIESAPASRRRRGGINRLHGISQTSPEKPMIMNIRRQPNLSHRYAVRIVPTARPKLVPHSTRPAGKPREDGLNNSLTILVLLAKYADSPIPRITRTRARAMRLPATPVSPQATDQRAKAPA